MIHNKTEEYDCVHNIVELSTCCLCGFFIVLEIVRVDIVNATFAKYKKGNRSSLKEQIRCQGSATRQISRCCQLYGSM